MRVTRLITTIAIVLLGVVLWATWGDAGASAVTDDDTVYQDTTAASESELSDRLREAFTKGQSVRVEYAPDGNAPPTQKEYWSRSLTDGEIAYARRQLARIRKTTDNMWHLADEDPLQAEIQTAQHMRNRLMVDAVEAVLDSGEGFLTKGPILSLKNDESWHFWNLMMRVVGKNMMLYAPIDLAANPEVLVWRKRADDLRDFSVTDAAYKWNARPYEERKQIMDDASAAHAEYATIRDEASQLAKKGKSRTASEQARLDELKARIKVLRAKVALAPNRVDERTLEWTIR